MSQDIRPLLAGWDFDPEGVQVRIITGEDGLEKIQMRLDLGLIQMELQGRPDGERPEGFESWLDRYQAKAREARAAGDDFGLSTEDCARLMREGIQFYHRYLAAFHLERYDLVARDTARNLELFAFVVQHASRPRDKLEFDRFRPYVQMMHARAQASQALLRDDFPGAIGHIDAGARAIRGFLTEYQQEDRESECSELQFLLQWRHELEGRLPIGPVERLEQQLEVAISLEHYEEAARLRDQIRRLRAFPEREPGPLGS
jgi:hypothetical protein